MHATTTVAVLILEGVVWQARRQLSRKAELLLELLAAGDAVEARIKAYSAEVDDLMLQLLQRRIEAAEKCEVAPCSCHASLLGIAKSFAAACRL